MAEINRQEGLTLRRLKHGGFLVTHPDIYNLGSLYIAATTIEEAFAFMREVLDKPAASAPQASE